MIEGHKNGGDGILNNDGEMTLAKKERHLFPL